ncbi:hypothetical protein M1293_02710 [Candidatus Parvarchaeota archaeon]|nr:hypothetical protein [Candidatus Parvarchaeota archaeon]
MSMTHKSQSALEYMMTYGWAILIIVIVAAVLYSLGIFSPSSSISSTVTGFSNLGSVAANCIYNEGLIISLGNSVGYPINVTTINITDTSSSTTTNAQINSIISPSSKAIFLIPTVCPAAGSHYSISATVSYTEPGQALPGPYQSKGSVTGTVLSSDSAQQISYSEPLTIDPPSSQDPPSPFQQMINITSSAPGWSHISSSPFGQNVEFTYSNGTVIPSWLENYTSSHAIWWVKLASYGSQTIFMDFAPTSTNLFNTVNDGEASQLSASYGDYNDMLNVMQPGLEYQIWYQPGYSIESPNSVLVGVPVGKNVPLNSPAGISYSKEGPFITNSSGTYFSGAGYETSTPISGYAILNNNNVLGQIPFENPPIINGTGYEFQIKFIGFIEVNQSVNFTFVYDDGIIAGIGYGTNTSNGAYWLSSLYHGNLRSGPISWDGNSGPSYGVWDHPGVYRFEIEYSQGAGGAGMNVLTNVTASYYYPKYPPNGVMPSVSFGSVS